MRELKTKLLTLDLEMYLNRPSNLLRYQGRIQ